MGCMGLLTKDIMNYLMARYKRITVTDIKMKKNIFQETFGTSLPIYVFFKFINYGLQYASKEKIPVKPEKFYKWHIIL